MNVSKLLKKSQFFLKLPYAQTASYSSNRRISENLNKNYDFEKLSSVPHDKLVYRTMKLQRLLDTYQLLCNPIHFCGSDKIRIDHPSPDDIVTDHVSMRKVAFKVLYLGWDYVGYAWEDRNWNQPFTGHTNVVERLIMEALLRQQLLPYIGSSKSMRWDRAGRTDRLVSGVSQVVAVRLRSSIKKGYGVWNRNNADQEIYDTDSDVTERQSTTSYYEEEFSNADTSLDEGELPYVKLLNEALPFDIRVLAWAPVSKKFSPRYHCKSRTYRYVFPRGRFNIDLMNKAAQKFVGTHDFRNFCRKSAENVFKHFEREIFSFKVEDVKGQSKHSEHNICTATICGSSFLTQQIRCMMAILGLIGEGKLPMEKIDELLDVERTNRKPGYNTYNAINLTLIDTSYDESDVSWRWDQQALANTANMLSEQYSELAVKTEIVRDMYSRMCERVECSQTLEDIAHGMTESLSSKKFGDGPDFISDVSKTVEEKQETYTKRNVRSLMRKGNYGKAAKLQTEYSTNTT